MQDQNSSNYSQYMLRCLELAGWGTGHVAPNPMVGAVLVFNDRIIGEGYHRKFGEAHAEVNCINSVKKEDRGLIKESVLFVSLEPCSHFGKTPPCSDLIIKHKIPKVVIGCRDVFPMVNGKGMAKLKEVGIAVESGILAGESKELNKRFFTFHEKHRPYIILKWAQTKNGFIAAQGPDRLRISNEYTNRLVHKWRSEEASILVGTNTALQDDPELTTRLYKGHSPLRLVIDMDLSLPLHLNLFNNNYPTIVFNLMKHEMNNTAVRYYQVSNDVSIVHQILDALYQLKIQSLIVEGGARLIQSFIDEGSWDEARIITNTGLEISQGLPAPILSPGKKISEQSLLTDQVQIFRNN